MTATVPYLDLVDVLEHELSRAVPGSRVASEHELAAANGVSRPTARAALQELERRYLVRRIRGSGTYVNRRVDYLVSYDMAPSWSETIRRAGAVPGSKIIRIRLSPASAKLRQRLELPPRSRVVVVTRRNTVDGLLASTATTHLPADLAPDLGRHLGDDDSLYRVLVERYGLDPKRVWSRASLEIPPVDVSERLGLETPEPTWLLESLNRDVSSKRPTELTQGWLRADVLRVVFEMGERP
ncbi:MAG: GntR family transcriptional regulator [Actinomycetota bacterium]|nr:GntR family transcriptional regulator [Actinomycetota bacterium]